jgi:hypothetical protein
MDVGSEEQGEDRSDHHEQETYSRLLRSISVGDPASNDQTDNLTGTRTVRQTRLPRWGHLVLRFRSVPFAVLFVEDGRGVEIAEQCQIVTLWWMMLALLPTRQSSACPLTHDESAAEQDRPSDCFGIGLDSLPETHLMLGSSSLAGLSGEDV